MAELLEACVRGRLNIVIGGGTGSGKTTLLNVLSSFVPDDERIVTIEDAAELQLRQEHVLRLESRPPNIEDRGEVTIRDLVRNALRMRPDRIIVGEVRGGEALDMLQAMNTGHDGSLTTLHANSPRDALSRIETMVLMAEIDLPQRAIREQIASAVDLIVHQTQAEDGTRRVTHITEVQRMEGDVITLPTCSMFDYSMGVDEDGRYRGTLQVDGDPPAVHRQAGRPRDHAVAHGLDYPGALAMTALTSSLTILLAIVFTAMFVIIYLVLSPLRRTVAQVSLSDRIERYGPLHGRETGVVARPEGRLGQTAVAWVERLMRSTKSESALAHAARQRRYRRQPAEWALLTVCGAWRLSPR